MNKNGVYSLYTIIDIRFADPVSAIGMNEKFVVTGSMMGRIAFLDLTEKKSILLAEISSENITGITFECADTFNISVGDEAVLKYKVSLNNSGQLVPDYIKLKNYVSDQIHTQFCEDCFTLLSNTHLAFFFLKQPTENNIIIKVEACTIKVYTLN